MDALILCLRQWTESHNLSLMFEGQLLFRSFNYLFHLCMRNGHVKGKGQTLDSDEHVYDGNFSQMSW